MIAITGWKHANFTLMGNILKSLGYEQTTRPDLFKGMYAHRNKYCASPEFCFNHQYYEIPVKYLIQVESPKKDINDAELEEWYCHYDAIMTVSKNDRFLYTLEELIIYPKYTLNRFFNFLRDRQNIDAMAELCRGHVYNDGNNLFLEGKYALIMKQMRRESHRDLF